MTAALFHLAPGALDEAEPGTVVLLDGAEGHHAATVMRLGPGETVQLSDAQRMRAQGRVLTAEPGRLQVQLDTVTEESVPVPRLVLVQALAKDRRDLQAVESATELGVDAVIPWQAERSIARWKPGREAKKHAEWVSTVTSAAKQTRRTRIPQVGDLHTTAQYAAARRAAADGAEPVRAGVVVLHEAEEVSLRRVLRDLGALEAGGTVSSEPPLAELHLVVGPEGGISDQELQRLTDASARTARLGRHVLRSSTAGPAAIAGTQMLLGRWDW